MIVKAIQIFAIILINLFAFLGLGHILDTLFGEKILYKMICLVLSIGPLIFLMMLYIKKLQKDIKKGL